MLHHSDGYRRTSPVDVASLTGLHVSTASQHLSRLAKRGWLTRHPDPGGAVCCRWRYCPPCPTCRGRGRYRGRVASPTSRGCQLARVSAVAAVDTGRLWTTGGRLRNRCKASRGIRDTSG
jgi:hypothetical protein